jgi:hypothetical protein
VTTTSPSTRAARIRARAKELSTKVPTRWFVTGLLGLFLAASAAFGGLEEADAPPLPQLDVGEAFTGAQLRIAIEDAVLIDAFPEALIIPAEGKRLLVVRATVENVWDRPVPATNGIGAADNVRPRGIKDLEDSPLTVAVISDGTKMPELQPGVPVELAFVWEVTPSAVGEDDVIRIDVLDKTYAAGGYVTYGERFQDPFVAAYAELPVTDVGAGVGAGQEEQTP